MEECLAACLDVLKLLKDEWLGFILSVGPEVFVSTSILKYEKNDSKLAPILGAGAVVIAKVNKA